MTTHNDPALTHLLHQLICHLVTATLCSSAAMLLGQASLTYLPLCATAQSKLSTSCLQVCHGELAPIPTPPRHLEHSVYFTAHIYF